MGGTEWSRVPHAARVFETPALFFPHFAGAPLDVETIGLRLLSPKPIGKPSLTDWPSNHCIHAQKFVSVSTKLNHNGSRRVLYSDKNVCRHNSSLWFTLY